MKALQKNLKWFDKNGKSFFWFLTCLLLLTTSFYIYLVNMAAFNGARWGKADQEITNLGAKVSELESRYFSLQQSVTLATAYAKGFADVSSVRFISTQTVGAVATANEI